MPQIQAMSLLMCASTSVTRAAASSSTTTQSQANTHSKHRCVAQQRRPTRRSKCWHVAVLLRPIDANVVRIALMAAYDSRALRPMMAVRAQIHEGRARSDPLTRNGGKPEQRYHACTDSSGTCSTVACKHTIAIIS